MPDYLLPRLTTVDNDEQRNVLLRTLAEAYGSDIEALIEAIETDDERIMLAALHVLQTIGYPDALPALPTLLSLVAYPSPLCRTAFETLASFGTPVLPHIFMLLQSSDKMQALIDDALDRVGLWLYPDEERARGTYSMLAERFVVELARHPEDVRDMLLYILNEALKEWWPFAVDTFALIGYPANASAIPLFIEQAVIFGPAGSNAVHALASLGPEVVVPYLLNILLHNETGDTRPMVKPGDICGLVIEPELDRVYAAACGPAILQHFQPVTALDKRDTEFLLRILEKIGPECGFYSLPTLIELWSRERNSEHGQRIQKLIATFEPSVVAPYNRLLTEAFLSDVRTLLLNVLAQKYRKEVREENRRKRNGDRNT